MLFTLFESLIQKTKENFPELKKVDYYKGELEEGTEWSPVFHACFLIVPI